jgi:hypothetical protein
VPVRIPLANGIAHTLEMRAHPADRQFAVPLLQRVQNGEVLVVVAAG